MGTLSLTNVKKSYGHLEVIHGVSLQVEDAEFVALVGPSGCGKSTLLRMIAGLESVTDGEIQLDNKRMNEVAPKDRDVAMVFQSYALYPHMTVRENMAFALRMGRVPKAKANKEIERAAEILGLGPYMERKPKELSGGQMQRVAMGRAIVRNPEIFLFDEPLSNLDAKLRGKVRGEIKALHARLKTTTIYVTHDQVEAMTLANRLVLMNDGYVEQIGTPLELYDTPKTPFVAGFIGTPPMNLFEGVISDAAEMDLDDGMKIVLSAEHIPQGLTGNAIVGIRPEHLTLADTGWLVTVKSVETTGHETHVTASLGDRDILFNMQGRDFPNEGDKVYVQPQFEAMHFFVDGKRV